MPRIARTVVANVPYHITQRGNRGQDIFFSTDDRKRYLERLSIYSSRFKLDILAYCLMTNHIHIVGIPHNTDSMSRTIQTVHMRHTQAINRIMGWKGHLWQSRFFSSALDDKHLWLAIRYVEQNPVRAGIVANAQEYLWSSAAFHCGMSSDSLISKIPGMADVFNGWDEVLKELPDPESVEKIRRNTYAGFPCGDKRFIRRISRKVGRAIVERVRGRPCKPDKKR